WEPSTSTIAFSPDLRLLAAGTDAGPVTVWDLGSRHRITTLRGHRGAVRQLVFTPDGKTLATGSEDRTARLWDLSSGRTLATLPGFKAYLTQWVGFPSSIAFSPDGRLLAMASRDGTVKLWADGSDTRESGGWGRSATGGAPRQVTAFPAVGSVAF